MVIISAGTFPDIAG